MAKIQESFNPVRAVMQGKKLKGIAKITLTDVNTGKERVSYDENLVTKAVEDLFSNNIMGLADYTKLLPVRSLYSGCLLFNDNLTENANSYIPPDQGTNALIAHAGDEAHTTANPRRGNPNMVETVIGDTSVKHVWTWDTSQGIGTIKSVALCPGILGNMGLIPFDTSYNPYQPLNVDKMEGSQGTTWTRANAQKHPIIIDSNNNQVKAVYIDGANFEEIVSFHDTALLGLSRGVNDFSEWSHRTVSLGDDLSNLSTYTVFNTEDAYYVVRSTSQSALKIYKINKLDFTVTTNIVTALSNIFYNSGLVGLIFKSCNAYPNTETHFWWPNQSRTTFYKIPFAGGAISDAEDVTLTPSANYHMMPVRINDKLILGENFLYNNDTFYPIALAALPAGAANNGNMGWTNIVHKSVVAGFGYQHGSGGQNTPIMATHNLFMSTINNLSEAKTKTAADVMKLEYTLTQV